MRGDDPVAALLLAVAVLLMGILAALDRWEALGELDRWRGRGAGASARSGGVGGRRPRGGSGRLGMPAPGGGPGTVGAADPGARLALVVAEVAARMRAGAPTAHAWRDTWARCPGLPPLGDIDEGGVPEGVLALSRRPRWGGVPRGGAGVSARRAAAVLKASTAGARTTRRAAVAVAAACRFTQHLGAPLADVLDSVADGIDEAGAAEDARRIAGQGPRTSTRVLTVLPVLGVAVGEALGAGPLERFGDGGVGTLCFLVGAICLVSGHLVGRAMLRRAERVDEGLDPALVCDLAVAGLESGASVPTVLEAIGGATGVVDLTRIGRELVLGASWERAWDPLPPCAALIAEALEPAWCDGTSPVPLLRRSASQLRAGRVADARARAEELGVRLVLPLGALLLPAFIALGVLPVLMHLAGGGLAGIV